MRKFTEKIYFHRDKEDNWDLTRKGEELGFSNSSDLVYLGYEVEMEVEISEDNKHKVLKINGIDISNKDITI